MTLVRDRLTWIVYATLGCYGYFLYSFNPSVPLLGADLGVSRAVASLHGTMMAVGALLAGVIVPPLVRRAGRLPVLSGALATLGVGTVVYVAAPVLGGTLLGALVAGTSGSVIVTVTSAVLAAHHPRAASAAISEANALAAAMGVAGPAALGAAVGIGWGWRPALGVVAVLAVGLLVAARGTFHGPPGQVRATPPRPGRLPAAYWHAWGVLVCCVGVEFATTIWTSQLLTERLGMGTAGATAAVTAVIAGMAVGRVLGGRLTIGRSPDRVLLGALLAALAGYALVLTAPSPAVAVSGLVVVGLGLALQFPLNVARLIEASAGRPDLATARQSLGAGLAIGGGPFLLGALADTLGVQTAFLLVPALLVLAGVGVLAHPVAGPALRPGRPRRP